MPIDKAKLDAIALGVSEALTTASNAVDVIAPEFAAFALIGRAVAKLEPGLVDDVVALLDKDEPTDAEVQGLATKLHTLLDPGSYV